MNNQYLKHYNIEVKKYKSITYKFVSDVVTHVEDDIDLKKVILFLIDLEKSVESFCDMIPEEKIFHIVNSLASDDHDLQSGLNDHVNIIMNSTLKNNLIKYKSDLNQLLIKNQIQSQCDNETLRFVVFSIIIVLYDLMKQETGDDPLGLDQIIN